MASPSGSRVGALRSPAGRGTLRLARYLLVRLVTVGLTISLGVFATVVLANRRGAIDQVVRNDIRNGVEYRLAAGLWTAETAEEAQHLQWEMEESAGLHLPFLPRHLRWLGNALAFRWGEAMAAESKDVLAYTSLSAVMGPSYTRFRVTQILATRLPFTLLLVGLADLIVFLLGIPLALALARRPGRWPDRIVGWLAPLASIPSWVHGILLVVVFGIGLQMLPFGGLYDTVPPETQGEAIRQIARHTILPVTAILLTLFLQCVSAWRGFFLIFSTEEYVELAVAQGLAPRVVERRYLLRPTLPYVITTFSLTLLGFWQMTTALEYFFDWPGIGQAYVHALQTYDIVVAVGTVVIFAYLLGFLVIGLDLACALVDPRIRLGGEGRALRVTARGRARPGTPRQGRRERPERQGMLRRPGAGELRARLADRRQSLRRAAAGLAALFRELVRDPPAVAGLGIIGLLLAMSLYALAAVPRGPATIAAAPVAVGEIPPPQNALPVWVNWFRAVDLPSTIALDSRSGQALKQVLPDQGAARHLRLTFTFDYPYHGVPQEMYLRLFARGTSKTFVTPRWIMPGGKEVPLAPRGVAGDEAYDLSENIPRSYLASHALAGQFRSREGRGGGQGGLAEYTALFTDPQDEEGRSVRGTYTVELDALGFEADSDLDAQLILVGRVWGWAGTDDARGDLWSALLWGAPSALIIGLGGGLVTTLTSLVLAAVGAWRGGWLDGLIQRLTEATMVLPILAVAVILRLLFGFSLWLVMASVVLVSALGTPVKAYRAAFLQVRGAAYIEAAQAYGAGNARVILRYMIPRIAPMIAPQLAILVPGFVFLEATLAIFGVSGTLPTWGNLIYTSLRAEVWQGNYLALIQPLGLCVLTGIGFALLGSALDRILNPRLKTA